MKPDESTPARVLPASSWLETAIPATDYHRTRRPKIDTSIWALLFSWLAPLGITLGIIGIVRSCRADKNVLGIILGSLAIVASLLLPVLIYFVSQSAQQLEVGQRVSSPIGFTVDVPKDAKLLSNSQTEFEYRTLADDPLLAKRYQVYEVDLDGSVSDVSPQAIETSLDDKNSEYYQYWLYQLFERSGETVTSVTAVKPYRGTLELGVEYSNGTFGVAALHFDAPNRIFVQLLEDDGTISSSLAVEDLFGSLGDTFNDRNGLNEWHKLVDSFQYNQERGR